MRWRYLLSWLWTLLGASLALGHPPVTTAALVHITREREITVTIFHDALAYALNDTSARIGDTEMYALLNGPENDLDAAFADGRDRIATGFQLRADDTLISCAVDRSPSVEDIHQWKKEHSGLTLPCKLDFVLRGRFNANVRSMSMQFPEVFADVIVVVHRPGIEPLNLPLRPGEESPRIDVRMPHVDATSGANGPADSTSAKSASSDYKPADEITALQIAWRYIVLGFEHIIPRGVDHCLFVLGLFLLSPRFKPVLWQISAFTVAHTVTLTLVSLNIIGLPSQIVEPAIAASIAFVGVENLLTTKVHSWRPMVAFVFGLVHGMGVATAFNEVGFPPGQLIASLLSFTIGVEGGHLAVLAAAFLALSWTRDKPWYRQRVAIPLSVLIALLAMYWVVQRLTASI